MRDLRRVSSAAVMGGLLALGAMAMAGSLPKLPADRALPRTGDSPGIVVFSHAGHIDPARPSCVTCHPGRFPMLQASASDSGIRHRRMDAGQQCGACHDGSQARGLEDCSGCHRE